MTIIKQEPQLIYLDLAVLEIQVLAAMMQTNSLTATRDLHQERADREGITRAQAKSLNHFELYHKKA